MNKETQELINSLSELVKIDSVESAPKEGMPFGEGAAKALNTALDIAKNMGFETINYDNYIGEVIFGDGEPFAVLSHLDVVPAGKFSDWEHPPFSAYFDGETLYGRGTIDDKGPLVATLYAMKRLKEEGFKPKKQIRLILGCDEESGKECIKHYLSYRPLPDTGFSPDADFPVIYAEKGILHFECTCHLNGDIVQSASGGVAPNVVPGYACVKGVYDADKARKFGLRKNGDLIESFGKTAHASEPHNGVNAIYPLICYMEEIGAVNRAIREVLFEDCLNLKQLSDVTGPLTMSPDMIKAENGKLVITVDVRYPATMDESVVIPKLENYFEIKLLAHEKPLYNDPDSKLIQTLLNVYNRNTGKNLQPIAIGGGTYARELKLGAGFGPVEAGEISLAHQPNEKITVKRLETLVNIYYDALKELTN